jgi:pimeloyl-ACP methyl ester carboxylesterase
MDNYESSNESNLQGPRMQIHEVIKCAPHEGAVGEGLIFKTTRGDVRSIFHESRNSDQSVIWVCGASGGFRGPATGLYAELSEYFVNYGISSLRMDYRYPNEFPECMLDLLSGITYLNKVGFAPPILVGHSFGGAVVIAAGAASPHVEGVIALSSQTYGAHMAGLVTPKPLLIVHGKSDTRLPYTCGEQIYGWAEEPKTLVLYDGAEHRLEECREELYELLAEWIPSTLSLTLDT